jgi:hypothetical protein
MLSQRIADASHCLPKHKIVIPAEGTFQEPTCGGVAHHSGSVEEAIGAASPGIKNVPNPCLMMEEAAISHPTGPGFACPKRVGHPACTPTGFVNKPFMVGLPTLREDPFPTINGGPPDVLSSG